MRALLVVVCLVRVASAEPTWTRQLPNSDGSSSFVAREGTDAVLLARTTTCSSWGTQIYGDTDLKPESQTPDYQFEMRPELCYWLKTDGTGIQVFRVRPMTGEAATVRALARAVLADAADPAPDLPGTWEHSRDDAARILDGHTHAWLDTSAAAAPCAPDGCTRAGEAVHRYTRGALVLDVPTATATDPSAQALVAWFDVLADDTALDRAVTIPPAPVAIPTPAAAAATAPDATTTAAIAEPEHHEPFNPESMLPKRYEFLFNDNWLNPAVGITYASDRPDGVAFVPVNAFGGTIIEHGGGIIGEINNAFLAGAGGYRGTETGSDGKRYEVWDTRIITKAGPEASWTFNISDQFMNFRADSFWNSWIGWRFGLWSMRQLNTDSGSMQMPGPTADMIARYNALYLYNAGGFEIEFLLKYDMLIPPLGRLRASLDLPVTYLCGAAFFGDDRDMLYTYGGVPRMSADLQRRVGPLMFHAVASIPTGWLVVPLQRGGQLTVSGGLTF